MYILLFEYTQGITQDFEMLSFYGVTFEYFFYIQNFFQNIFISK